MIRSKLLLAFGTLLGMAMLVSFVGVRSLAIMNDRTLAISTDWLPSVKASGAINAQLAAVRIARLKLRTSYKSATSEELSPQ